MSVYIDIESIPQAREILEAKLPEELRNPRMPEDLANPVEPNWAEKAPAYGLPELRKKFGALQEEFSIIINAEDRPTPSSATDDEKTKKAKDKLFDAWIKKRDSIAVKGDAAEVALKEAEEKQAAWIREAHEKWNTGLLDAIEAWKLKSIESKIAATRKAALDARQGHCKLIGMKCDGFTRIFIWEPDLETVMKVRKWFQALEKVQDDMRFEYTGPRPTRIFRGRPILISEFRDEALMLKTFFDAFFDEMEPMDGKGQNCITFYGNTFDFPFLYRRSWILGNAQMPMYRRGRYWTERMIDVHESWTFGSREEKSGGLEGLCVTLGAEAVKANDSATFGEWYAKDPVEGIYHLANDLDSTEYAAKKMGLK